MLKDTHRTATIDRAELKLPKRVTVAFAELAGAARAGPRRRAIPASSIPLAWSARCSAGMASSGDQAVLQTSGKR